MLNGRPEKGRGRFAAGKLGLLDVLGAGDGATVLATAAKQASGKRQELQAQMFGLALSMNSFFVLGVCHDHLLPRSHIFAHSRTLLELWVGGFNAARPAGCSGAHRQGVWRKEEVAPYLTL